MEKQAEINSPHFTIYMKCQLKLATEVRRRWESRVREEVVVSMTSQQQQLSVGDEEVQRFHLSEHILSINMSTTVTKLSLIRVLEQQLHGFKQYKIFYLKKFYSSERELME